MGFGLNTISFFMYRLFGTIAVLVYALLTILFIVYELDEDLHLSDEAFTDIFYFGWGIGISYLLLFILTLLL